MRWVYRVVEVAWGNRIAEQDALMLADEGAVRVVAALGSGH